MLDATGVKDETELRNETEPQNADWDKILDNSAESDDQSTGKESGEAIEADAETTAGAAESTGEQAEETDAPESPSDTSPPESERTETAEDFIDRIREAREDVRAAKLKWIDDKEAAAASKKAYETAVDRLASVIDDGPQRYPLFEHMEQNQGPPTPADAATDVEAPTAESVEGPPAEDESWREVKLADIDLPAGICKLLEANPEKPITTIGDVADWTTAQKHSADPLLLIPRIGKAKRDTIVECCEKFWEKSQTKATDGKATDG